MTEAFPLVWPAGKPRNRYPQRSRFDVTFALARDCLLREIKMLGGSLPVLSTNIPLRLDGLPYANHRKPEDKGVAVYFTLKGNPMCFACDRWDSVADNTQAIRRTIEALRGIERWGSGSMVEQAFTGFMALPGTSPWDILGVPRTSTREQIEAAYRQKAKAAHPDQDGGSHDAMTRLNVAKDEALKNAG